MRQREKEGSWVSEEIKLYNFCDWITIRVAFRHKAGLFGDKILRIDGNGQSKWTKNLWQRVESEASSSVATSLKSISDDDIRAPFERIAKKDDKLTVDEKLMFRYGQDIEHDEPFLFVDISGNPTKFLQGQNVWGSDDIEGACVAYLKQVLKESNIWQAMNKGERAKVERLDVYCTRFDLTTNLIMKTESDKKAFLAAVAQQAESKRGKVNVVNTTTYFGAETWCQVKFYDKIAEVMANLPKLDFKATKQENEPIIKMLKFVSAVNIELLPYVRCELRIGKDYIRDNKINKLYKIIEHINEKAEVKKGGLIMEKVSALKLGQKGTTTATIKEATLKLEELRREKVINAALVNTFKLWATGENVRDCVSKATFYRHRKELIGLVSVDVSLINVEAKEQRSKIVPLIREVEAATCSPSQAFDDYIYPRSVFA